MSWCALMPRTCAWHRRALPAATCMAHGCTLSSAIAAYLALGHPLGSAVAQARSYILSAIAQGENVLTGRGHGPLNHGFAPLALHRITKPPSTINT